jgi:protein phosphatase
MSDGCDDQATMPAVTLPDPSLVLLVGAAGSGKSTFAARHFAADEVLSSDTFRAQLSGDEANQAVSGAAFALLHRILEERLASRRLTVVDATNVQGRARGELLRLARNARVSSVAIVLDLPTEVILARNAARPRVVEEHVIRAQVRALRRSMALDRLDAEGYDLVVRLGSVEAVDAVRFERTPADPLAGG